MADFSKLAALAAKRKEDSTDAQQASAPQVVAAPASSDSAGEVYKPAQDSGQPDSPKGAGGGLGFLASLGKARGETPSPAPTPSPAAPATGLAFLAKKSPPAASPAPVVPATPVETKGPVGDDGEISLDSLMASTAEGKAPKQDSSGVPAGFVSRFAEETPADAPLREVPTDADKLMRQFIESLDTVYKVVHEPELMSNVIQSIMTELSSHPEYRKLIQPEDIHVMVRGMRNAMGLARVKKEESKAKRGGGGAAASKKTRVKNEDAMAELNELLGGDFA